MNQSVQQIWQYLADIKDPEVPVLSILDLGIVRAVEVDGQGRVTVAITPTYSGCPAMDVIALSVRLALAGHGLRDVEVQNRLSPAWTTDWMTEDGKRKLKEYGIAPPNRKAFQELGLFEDEEIACPRCNATDTVLVSRFGPTSCKALYKCNACHEPFEHFKCH